MRVKVVMAFLITIIIAGCQPSHQLYEVSDVPYGKERVLLKAPVPKEFFVAAEELQTLITTGEAFNTVGEWYDNESILYIVDAAGGSEVLKYHLFTGEKAPFFSTDSPILSVKANQDQTMFLFHLSGTRDRAELVIVDHKGTELFNWEVEAYDIDYTWNPYNPEQVFVTAFLEDWSFSTTLVDVVAKTTIKQDVPQPFVKWLDETQIAYMDWDEEEPSVDAPLYQLDLTTGENHLLNEQIISFFAYKNALLTIETDDERESYSTYIFQKPISNEKVGELSLPTLSDYSGWYIPHHDFVSNDLFYTFRPYETGPYDTYSKKFELIAYSIESNEETIILSEVDSLPLNFSPNGKYALYGYQYEKIIDVSHKTVKQLVRP